MPDFMDQYATTQLNAFEASGLNSEELAIKKQELEDWLTLYENPFIMAGITFLEFFPIGLLGALVSAFLLRRK